jgi:hypothetical protein
MIENSNFDKKNKKKIKPHTSHNSNLKYKL